MGLSSLNAALSGLAISQAQIDVISNNVANVGTEGYTRKILPQSAQAVDGRTVGVRPETIIRQVDLTLSRDLWTQVSDTGFYNVQSSYLNRILEFHGPPDKELSIASEIDRLFNSFNALSDDPGDSFLQSQVVSEAQDTASKINALSDLITRLRNDAQDEISDTINRINGLLDQIADYNEDISNNANTGRTTARAEDLRDEAIKELSGLMEISFFQSGDGMLIVQTNQGIELASNRVTHLTFDPKRLSPTVFYPDSAAGIYVGDPAVNPTAAFDITATNIGGKLGGLLALRDEKFPQQMAQIDELAHKMAQRFEAQGLRLFTDDSGLIPADTAPNLTTNPETAVPYIGFSANIQVNQAILADHTLLQLGTSGENIQAGSNEIISRVLENVFGSISHDEAIGNIDLRAAALGANSLQEYLGITSQNVVEGGRDLSTSASVEDIITAANGTLDPTNDTFRIVLSDPDIDGGIGAINVDVSLSAIAPTAGNAAQELADYLNTYIGAAGPLTPAEQADLATMNVQFGVGSNGQLVISSEGDVTLDATAPANAMGAEGLALLGFVEGTTEAEDPYFDIVIGNQDAQRVFINPADDSASFLAKLQAVDGLAVEDFTTSADGFLRLRPGEDYANPKFGGDMKILAGPFVTNAAASGTPDGVNIVSSLFGSFNAGPPVQDASPVSRMDYGSTVSSTDSSQIAFREDFLGPNGDISTGIIGASSLGDYARKMVNFIAQESIVVEERAQDTNTLRNLLQERLLDESGVNLDEELSNLILVQTAYSASARVINAVEESFQELLNALR